MNANELSEQLLNAVKMNLPSKSLEESIANLTENELQTALQSQENRLAFWLNLYNAFFQIKIKAQPELFKNKIKLFFGRHFLVAKTSLSLDDIEHNMLRKSTYKWSFGYIKNPFPSAFEKKFQVFELDPRVHFAMNCGAISCPPIRFYTSETVQEQLDIATINFLAQETLVDKNVVQVTPLFNWFRGDFGGINGIKQFLLRYQIIKHLDIKIKFKKYNWTNQFENFAS